MFVVLVELCLLLIWVCMIWFWVDIRCGFVFCCFWFVVFSMFCDGFCELLWVWLLVVFCWISGCVWLLFAVLLVFVLDGVVGCFTLVGDCLRFVCFDFMFLDFSYWLDVCFLFIFVWFCVLFCLLIVCCRFGVCGCWFDMLFCLYT